MRLVQAIALKRSVRSQNALLRFCTGKVLSRHFKCCEGLTVGSFEH